MGSWLSQPTSQSEPIWSPPGSRRSTIDLVQSCVLTLIICSWTAVHPDIPPKGKQHWWMFSKLMAALCAIVMPEYFLRMAFDELWEARLICEELKKLEKSELTTADQTDFPNDQGLNLDANGGCIGKIFCRFWHKVCEDWRRLFPSELERGFYIEMGGFELVAASANKDGLPKGYRGRVTVRGALELARAGLLPKVPLELINDQSKSDMLSKFLVCLQASWMIVQSIARVHQSLPVTLLEVLTVVHAVCAFFIYCLWLMKPHDVKVTTKVQVNEETLKKLQDIQLTISPPDSLSFTEKWTRYTAVKRSSCRLSQSKESPIDQSVMAYLVFPIYGGAHLVVWNEHFPSYIERILWIASALSIGCLPFFWMFLSKWIKTWFPNGRADPSSRHPGFLYRIGLVCWGLARAYLVVESFASLRSLPVGSYKTVSWVSLIPHF